MKREDLETLAKIRKLTGVQIRLGEHDEIMGYQAKVGAIHVAVTTYLVQETTREIRFKKSGFKIYTISLVGDGTWWRLTDTTDTHWDDTFQPYVYEKFSRYESQDEITARHEWETMCHRPGTARTPMDNLDRQFQGYDYGPTSHTTES